MVFYNSLLPLPLLVTLLFISFNRTSCQVIPDIRSRICGSVAEEQAQCATREGFLQRRELYDILEVGYFTDYLPARNDSSTWHNVAECLIPRQASSSSDIIKILQHVCPGSDCNIKLMNTLSAGDRATLHTLLGQKGLKNAFTINDLIPVHKLLSQWEELGVDLTHGNQAEPEPGIIDDGKEANKTEIEIADEEGDKAEVPGKEDMNEDGNVTVEDHERVTALEICKHSPPSSGGYKSSGAHEYIKDLWEVWYKAHPFASHRNNFANDIIVDLINSTESPAVEKPCPSMKECHPHVCERVARINITKPEDILKTAYALEALAWFEEKAYHTGRLIASLGLSHVLKSRKLMDKYHSDPTRIKEEQMKQWDQFVLEDHLLYAGVFGLGMLFLDASEPNTKPDYHAVQEQAKWFDEAPNVHAQFQGTVADLGATMDLEKAISSNTDIISEMKNHTIGLVFGMFEMLIPKWAKETLQGIPDHASGKTLPDYLKDIDNWEYPAPKDKGAVTRLFYGVLLNRVWRLQHTYIVEADVQKDHCKIDSRGEPALRVCLDDEPYRVYYIQHVRPDITAVNNREWFAKVSGPRGYDRLEDGVTLEDIVRSSVAHYRDHHFNPITPTEIKGLHYLDSEWVQKIGGRMPGIFTIPILRNPAGQAISQVDAARAITNYPCMAGPLPWRGGRLPGSQYDSRKDYSQSFILATCLHTHPMFQNQCERQQRCKAEGGRTLPKFEFTDESTYCYGETRVHDLPFRYCLGHKGQEYPIDGDFHK